MVRLGDKVSQRYEVLEQLATGGMGTLWRARHIELDVDIALKVIASEAATPLLLKRFKHEAQAAARLRSPNIVHVQDYGVFEGEPYLAMELLQGEDLAARLARVGRLSPRAALPILEGVARAMETAHASGIVHRDLKPANIFLERGREDDGVKVLDFGIAKDTSRPADPLHTTGATAVGTPAYMSPEQLWGEPVSSRSDLWSMGALAFEMLSGKPPFAEESLAKVFDRILRAPLPRLREHAPELPADFEFFFAKALARTPDERFASASEFVAAFRDAAQGKLTRPRSGTARRGRLELVVGSAVVTTALVAGAFFHRSAVPSRAERPHQVAPATSAMAAAGSPRHDTSAANAPAPAEAASPVAIVNEHPPSQTAKKKSHAASRPSNVASPAVPGATAAPKFDPQFGIPLPP